MKPEDIEKEVVEKNLTAPRVNVERINSIITKEEYHVFSGVHTVCCLTLENGFTVIGESACVSPKNFDEELGRKIARDKAREKIWGLEAYLLADKRYHNGLD